MDLHHAGIATDDADALIELYGELLDVSVADDDVLNGLRLVFLEAGGTYLELLEPIDAGTTLGDYLDRHGPGIHHLAFATADVQSALDHARSLGVETVDETPREGAFGHAVAFLHPKSTGDVLIEFVER